MKTGVKIGLGIAAVAAAFLAWKKFSSKKSLSPTLSKNWVNPSNGEERNSHISSVNTDGTISNRYHPGAIGIRTSENRIDWTYADGTKDYWATAALGMITGSASMSNLLR